MDAKQLKQLIEKVLKFVGYYSVEATDLLVLTAAVESNCGRYIYQFNGPAKGVFQIEPTTLTDLYQNYLVYHKSSLHKLEMFRTTALEFDLEGNLPYQIVAARLQYYRFPAMIPKKEWYKMDKFSYMQGLAKYWKKYWNTYKGAGTVKKAIDSYHLFVRNGGGV